MDGLFDKGLFVTRNSYARSVAASSRRSIQLLPVEKGPATEEAPWMEDMVRRVQEVLTELGILGEQHELGALTLLLSMPGACQQDYHCDFPWNHRVFSRKSLEKNGTVPPRFCPHRVSQRRCVASFDARKNDRLREVFRGYFSRRSRTRRRRVDTPPAGLELSCPHVLRYGREECVGVEDLQSS